MDTETSAREPIGVMQQISEHLEGGKTSTEVISLGYKSSTVYKVKRQLIRRAQANGRVPVTGNDQLANATRNVAHQSHLDIENARLQQEIDDLTCQLDFAQTLTLELVEKEDEMEAEARSLHDRLNALQPEASAAVQLRQRVKEIEGHLQHAAHTEAAMHQGAVQWRQKVEAEQAARQEAEEEASTLKQENQELHRELDERQQWGTRASQVFETMDAEAKALRPLKAWVGHPCRVCKKPMAGAVSRELAASLLENCGHKACLESEDRGFVPWLIGGAALYGLSKLTKG